VLFPRAVAAQSSESTQSSVLSPQSAAITVTASRTPTRLADTPTSVVVLDREALATTAAVTLDDTLRQVPGFTLFRRSGSTTANPTSQGVSLRGIGASGASRALVLDDGIPLNDPFGGWVYWDRLPRAAVDRIEVVRGGASDLYGSSAMGGVVQFLRRPATDSLVVEVSAGSQQTRSGSFFAAGQNADWRGSIAADLFSTGGYIPVAPEQRGAVDRAANSRHTAIDATVERSFAESARAFARLSHFAESRNNGTPLQINDTAIRQFAAGVDAGGFTFRAYDTTERYHQTFSAIAADRATERLTQDQRTPSHATGGSAQFAHAIGDRSLLVAGAEERSVNARSDSTSGHQRTSSAFLEDTMLFTNRLSATAALRYDAWRDSAWSPRLSMLYHATDSVAFTASAYKAFRAPTLNELIRPFRVGNVLTLANDSLGPERLSAVEAGIRTGPLRVTLFSMRTDDVIANVTRSITPTLITRQRANLGFSRSRGIEAETDFHIAADWRVSAGYLFADATLDTGKRTPQVPRNQATLQLAFRGLAGVQARWSSVQFDDDLNQFPLHGYVVADAFVAHPIAGGLDATLAIDNLFDRRIETAATPVINLGQPRALRVGLRYGIR
jgi:iron complex outermembrane recepter protein